MEDLLRKVRAQLFAFVGNLIEASTKRILKALADNQSASQKASDEAIKRLEKRAAEILKSTALEAKRIMAKVKNGREGKPGRAGKDADEKRIISLLSKKLKQAPEKKLTMEDVQKIIRSTRPRKVGGGGDVNHPADLSTLTDGNTKSFTVPKHRKAYFVISSDAPILLLENNGFTVNSARTQIILTTPNAPSQGSQLLFFYGL